jgi:Putative amidoligase enzyme
MTTTATRQRQIDAYTMRQSGASYHSIAIALGWTNGETVYPGSARKAVLAEAKRHAFLLGTTRKFGVEIEFVGITRSMAVTALTNAGIAAYDAGYTHNVSTKWKVVSDGSLSSPYGSGEVVSPILQGEAGFTALRTVVNALRAAGARVTKSTGLHVHHDANDLSHEQVARVLEFYARNKTHIDRLVSASRKYNTYCQPFNNAELQSVTAKVRAGHFIAGGGGSAGITRYKHVNIAAYLKYGTLEFRQHQGSLNADKVIAWVKFGQAVLQAAVNGADSDTSASLDEMLDGLASKAGLDTSSAAYLKARAARLAS